jgi:YgiT-type zinc finger domain-containing protein
MNMKFKKCPLCGSRAIQEKQGTYKLNIHGKAVLTPDVTYWECPSCGEAFFDREANKKIDAALLPRRKRVLTKVA